LKEDAKKLIDRIDYNIVYYPRYKLEKLGSDVISPRYMDADVFENLLKSYNVQ